MKKSLPGIYFTFLILVLWGGEIFTEQGLFAQNIPRRLETEISFPADLYTPEIKFDLQPIGNRKFKIVLDQKSNQLTKVKVFDILGNLIMEDKISPEDGTQKLYDFSNLNSQLFVVEVGNAKYNKTKSIYAYPPGTRVKESEE
ncbi:T9SS type A sorting domain-containing protein [Pleomorphovibrio marinus]|uniref:T9SS type A sorting domain-containing protein n=1 Tax=Pleomorphovibrio marinus TaxID=2164132 RepID=UPI001E3EF744|nr:T9SS type A sorting domain-containing protein [Pleomorphovibrio marinus]